MLKAIFSGLGELLKELIQLADQIKDPYNFILLMAMISLLYFIMSVSVAAVWAKVVWLITLMLTA